MGILGELRIIKDHIYFRIIRCTRPLTIHTECLHNDKVWDSAKRFVASGKKAIWYVITPVNSGLANREAGCDMSRRSWEKTTLKRYLWLRDHGQQIEAHVHLRVKMGLYSSEKEARGDKEMKIRGAASWLRKSGFSPSRIVFGWWSFDEHAARIAEEEGLKVTQRLDYYFIHDYDLLEYRAK